MNELEGRELAEAVAIEIMGWTALREPGKAHLWMPPEHFISGWRPDRDIADAMLVVEKMKERKPRLMINLAMFWGHKAWVYKAEFIEETSPKDWASYCDDWPEAICRAAVMAAEAE